jgi:hypothetical protein
MEIIYFPEQVIPASYKYQREVFLNGHDPWGVIIGQGIPKKLNADYGNKYYKSRTRLKAKLREFGIDVAGGRWVRRNEPVRLEFCYIAHKRYKNMLAVKKVTERMFGPNSFDMLEYYNSEIKPKTQGNMVYYRCDN